MIIKELSSCYEWILKHYLDILDLDEVYRKPRAFTMETNFGKIRSVPKNLIVGEGRAVFFQPDKRSVENFYNTEKFLLKGLRNSS